MNDEQGKVSRRRFLETAVVTAAVAGAGSDVSAETAAVAASGLTSDRARLEELVSAFGSELGDLRKVQ